jgi:hypothetical protein
MFVSELIPGLWICDYDLIQSNYFKTRNIKTYIHIYSYRNEYANLQLNYNQEHIQIYIKDIITHSKEPAILRQNTQYSEEFGRKIIENIDIVTDVLDRIHGVVIYSKFGIQKAATFACGFLIAMGNLRTDNAIKIMYSKEPLFFKDPVSTNRDERVVLYRDALKYVEFKY